MVDTKILKAAAISGIVAVASAIAYSIWGLLPNYVTESVTVMTSDSSGCIVETSDKYDVKIGPCHAKPGDVITVTYDAKIKERYQALQTP